MKASGSMELGEGTGLSRKSLAARLGLGMGALLLYERAGLIPPPRRAPNGYRLYSEKDAARLALVVKAKGLGLTLREIGELVRGIDEGLPRERLQEGMLRKAELLQRRIEELEAARNALLEMAASPKLGRCDELLAARSADAPPAVAPSAEDRRFPA